MLNLLTEAGHDAFRRFCTAGPVLYAFDYDGTLSPIVEVPEKAVMRPATLKAITELAVRAPVAVISGRGSRDVGARLGFTPRSLIGNHGIEGETTTPAQREEASAIVLAWKTQLDRLVPIAMIAAGVSVEDKTYSISIHYRRAPDHQKVRLELGQLLEASVRSGALRPAPRVISGKDVFNLVMQGSPDKGSALTALMAKLGIERAVFAGDDDTDEDVFRRRDPRIFGIRVGERRDSDAPYFIPGQSDIERVLEECLRYAPS